MKMKNYLILIALPFFITGCMSSVQDVRSSGPDSTYQASKPARETAVCIQDGWRNVFASDPSRVWLTDKDVKNRYTVYTPAFLYMVDVIDNGEHSDVIYYHNGDHLWGTKEKLIYQIEKCL